MVDKDLMDMLVRELKDELEARSESKTGNKAWLRRRLHGALVRVIIWTPRSRRLASITRFARSGARKSHFFQLKTGMRRCF